MKTRIKFIYDDGSKGKNRLNSDIAISKEAFKVDDQYVYIFLNLKDMYFEFLDTEGKPLFRGGNTKNSEVLLQQVKDELKKRGCRFAKETRTKDERPQSTQN